MSRESLKEEARRHEQREDWAKALDLYLQAIDAQGEGEEPDIALHNRVGDLQVRLGDIDGAVSSYENAIDLYVEADLSNNAIAICRKIVRSDPKRPGPFLRMGKIRASQGFLVDARQNVLTYAEMMQARGKTEDALGALQEFVEVAGEDVETRIFLAEQLVVRERPEEGARYLAEAYRVLVRGRENERAEGILERLREIAPGHPVPTVGAAAEEAGADAADDVFTGFETTSLGLPDSAEPAVASGVAAEEVPRDFGFSDIAFGEIGEEAASPEEEAPEEEEAIPLPTMFGAEEDVPEADAVPLPTFGDEIGDDSPLPGFDEADLSFMSVESEPGEEEDEPAPDLPLISFDVEQPAPASVAEPSEADGWRRRGRELIEAGDESKGRNAFERAHAAYAATGESRAAMSVVRELLELDPIRLDLRQRLVEYAYQSNDRELLVEAFIELADALSEHGKRSKAEAVYRQVLALDPGNARSLAALERAPDAPVSARTSGAPPAVEAPPAPPATPAPPRGEGYVDLGALILDEDEEKTTRWVVAAGAPSGDEAADFARMLAQFKEKVSKNLSSDDAKAHYDLGTAYKEMGLLDEAIEEFQRSLRADPGSLASFEMLGQCFLDKGEPVAAIRTLERGMRLPTQVEDDLLGVYYYMGKANETIGNSTAARDFYEKIFSLDINFKDVTERLRILR